MRLHRRKSKRLQSTCSIWTGSRPSSFVPRESPNNRRTRSVMVTKDVLNPRLLSAEYAVRGPIVLRAQQLEEQGRKIIYCNIGNPQALKQAPLSFLRQLLSLVEYPELLNHPETLKLYPRDIVARATSILEKHPQGTGAYSQSPGIP